MLTQERADILAEFMNADPKRAERLAPLEPNEVEAALKSYGLNFTIDELKEFAAIVNAQR